MKLPPTLTRSEAFKMFSGLFQSHFAGGFSLLCTASSRYGFLNDGDASAGVDVRVKPPTFGRPGIMTSSHWPGINYAGGMGVSYGLHQFCSYKR